MVAFSARAFFVATLVAAVSAGTISFKRSAATIEADIAKISTQVNSLDSSINAFPTTGGTLFQALAINTAASKLVTAIKSATTDTKATSSITAAEGQTIINDVKGFEPAILDALTAIVGKKAAFAALPINADGIVRADLKNLQTATSAFEAALIALAPTELKDDAQAISSSIDAAFVDAVAAYN